MGTDFTYGNKTITTSGPTKPATKNSPGDVRTRVQNFADISTIPMPYIGMPIVVLTDETNENKMTEYRVKSLKADTLGVQDTVVNEVVRLKDFLEISNSGNGLTSEQAQQLQTAYEHSQSPHVTTGDVNTAIQTYINDNISLLKGDKGDTGAKGQDGITPTLRVGSVTTLEAGNNATVTMSESNNEYTLNFGIPKGAKGDTGASGSGDSGSVASSEWSGKVANFLGDSQTEANEHKTKIYHDWVKEILGLSKVNNYGISGTTIAKKKSNDNTAMSVRYTNMDNNADLICVMGGVNDTWFNCQLGKFGDSDPITFYGAMEKLCDGLLTKYPGKTIIFITPTEQNNGNCSSANTTGYTPTDFANAMKRVCAKYSIPVFDANTCLGIYPLNEANARLYTTDKLHLNNKGHEVLGNKLSKFILNGANVVMINSDNSGGSSGGSTPETPSQPPVENQFIGKTVTVAKNYQGTISHLTALINVDDDMRRNSTYDIILKGSNVSNMSSETKSGGQIFSDNSGEVSNDSYVEEIASQGKFTQTVSNGNLSITVTQRTASATTSYVKVPIVISGTVPYSFRIDEIKVIVNNVERKILKLGSFFNSNQETITIE